MQNWLVTVQRHVMAARIILHEDYGFPATYDALLEAIKGYQQIKPYDGCATQAVLFINGYERLLKYTKQGRIDLALNTITELFDNAIELKIKTIPDNKPIKKGLPPIRDMYFVDNVKDQSIENILAKGFNRLSSQNSCGGLNKFEHKKHWQPFAEKLYKKGERRAAVAIKVYDELVKNGFIKTSIEFAERAKMEESITIAIKLSHLKY